MARNNQPNMLSKAREWLMGALEEKVPAEQQLQRDAAAMMDELDKHAELTSFCMARADEKFEELQREVARHEALSTQSEAFLREGDEEAARRCVALQLESAGHIRKLQEDYEALQRDAEDKAHQFLDKKNSIEKRVAQIPQLQDDARIVRMHEEMEKSFSALSIESAQNSFDATARELETQRRQMANRQALLQDPNAALDRRIAGDAREREIDRAMSSLRARLNMGATIIEGEVEEAKNTVQSARQLLSTQRYKGILPGASRPSNAPSSTQRNADARDKAHNE